MTWHGRMMFCPDVTLNTWLDVKNVGSSVTTSTLKSAPCDPATNKPIFIRFVRDTKENFNFLSCLLDNIFLMSYGIEKPCCFRRNIYWTTACDYSMLIVFRYHKIMPSLLLDLFIKSSFFRYFSFENIYSEIALLFCECNYVLTAFQIQVPALLLLAM